MFKEYDNKPKKISAVRFTDLNKDMVFNYLAGSGCHDFENGEPIIRVTMMNGDTAIVRLGDWVVKEEKSGHYYPITNEYFIKSYIVK